MGLAASRQEAFWEACGFGHIGRAKAFLKEGEIDVNWVSYVNDSCPIHVASQGKSEIVDLLIANNCDVNVKDGRGNLAIHHAAMKGHADIVQKLIDAGSEINTQEKNGWTALHNAAYWCHPDVVDVLLKNECDVGILNKDRRTALHECARSQNTDDCKLGKVAKLLIDAGSDVNAKSSDWGEADLTALMCAAFHNHPEVAIALIDGNCDIDAIGTTYWTALHWAADRGNEELVYILVEAGADPSKRDLKGETALDRAGTDNIREVLTTVTHLHKELQMVNNPVIQPVTCLRKPVEPYVPKCDPKFKSQSLLPATWTSSSSNVKNLINAKKSRLAAQTSQTYRQELARRTGTNTITDDEFKKELSDKEEADRTADKNNSQNCDDKDSEEIHTKNCDRNSEKLIEINQVESETNSNSEILEKIEERKKDTDINHVVKTDVEKIDVVKTDVEKIDVAKTDVEKIDVAKTDVEKIDVAKTDVEKIDVAKTYAAKDEENATLISDLTTGCSPEEQQCNNDGGNVMTN